MFKINFFSFMYWTNFPNVIPWHLTYVLKFYNFYKYDLLGSYIQSWNLWPGMMAWPYSYYSITYYI